jgi:hypothetical protein
MPVAVIAPLIVALIAALVLFAASVAVGLLIGRRGLDERPEAWSGSSSRVQHGQGGVRLS